MINTVTLCGSVRFLDDFNTANAELTARGMSVFGIGMALDNDRQREEAHVKEVLDLVHFNKILRSDAILVVGNGYIGFSTAREILWSVMQGKPVYTTTEYKLPDGSVQWNRLLDDIAFGDDQEELLVEAARNVLLAKAKENHVG